MTNPAPRPALGFESAHIANQYTIEHITERGDEGPLENDRVSVLIYDPRDPDEEDAQIRTLSEATGITLPYFR